LIVIYTPVDRRTIDATLGAIRDGIAAARRSGAVDKPVLACVMAEPGHASQLTVDDETVPAYTFPENAARALAKITKYSDWRRKTPGLLWGFDDVRIDAARTVCRTAITARGATWLTADETREVLEAFRLPIAAAAMAHNVEEAAALAQVIGFPVAAKLAARGVSHKTDIGAVRLNLANGAAVRRAFVEIMTRAHKAASETDTDGVLIQAMIAGGVETMIGISDDPMFGPLVAFGLGGINVEILRDVHFRLAPLTDNDADELLHGIRGLPLLQGYRGHPPADLEALRELLLRISRLAVDVPEVAELDLNPVIALAPGQGCRVVDARIRVQPPR
jgi:acyl-CoA synthetase (NDP forming)